MCVQKTYNISVEPNSGVLYAYFFLQSKQSTDCRLLYKRKETIIMQEIIQDENILTSVIKTNEPKNLKHITFYNNHKYTIAKGNTICCNTEVQASRYDETTACPICNAPIQWNLLFL